MEWELTKENHVPVRSGRKLAGLAAQDPAQEALEAKRRDLWEEITEYKGDDPLEPWQRYIKWMQEYGVGGGKADLMKVLEACTKELQKYPRYTNDIRFLRIWIQYADCLPDPDDVFLFLKEKGIGRDFALYYEAYATYFELKGNFQGADAVYMDGIQRGVKQLERLKQKHHAFQQRMAQRVQRRIQDEQVMGPPPPEPVRANLAAIGARGAARGALGQPQQQSSAGIFGVGAAPQQASGMFGPRPGPAQQPRGPRPGIGLHEDEEFGGGENPRIGLPGYSTMPQQANSARELQPYGVRRKENLDRALAWNQAALLPGAAPPSVGPAVGGGGIDIFTDEEFQDGSDDPPGRVGGAGQQQQRGGASAATDASAGQALLLTSADRSAGAGVDSLVFSLAPPRMPLLRGLPPGPTHSVSESIAALSASGTASGAPVAAALAQRPNMPRHGSLSAAAAEAGPLARQPDGAASGGGSYGARLGASSASEEVGVPSTAGEAPGEPASGEGDEEMSYEELRAVVWFRRNPASRLQANPTPWVSRLGSASAAPNGAQAAAAEPKRTALSSLPAATHAGSSVALRSAGGTENGPSADPTSRSASACAPAGRAGQVLPAAAAAAVPLQQLLSDIGTASEENGPVAAGRSQSRRALGDVAPGARVPLGQPAGAAGAGFPAAHHGLRPEPPPLLPAAVPTSAAARDRDRRHDDAQATVTISTRGAFDLINSLFSEDLPHQQARANAGQSQPCSSRAEPAPPPPPAIQQQQQQPPVAARPPWPQPPSAHQTSLPAPQPQPSVAEPTVTLHTKLAFDALNDMFCDTLPHEEVRKLARRAAPSGGGLGHMPIRNADVCRLANAGRSNCAAAAPGTGRREPLGIGSGGAGAHGGAAEPTLPTAHALAASAASLAIHEDTFFLGPAPAAVAPADALRVGSVGCGIRLGPSAGQGSSATHGPSVGALYEDTEFIPRSGGGGAGLPGGNAAAPSSGAFILEDTEFMTRHHGTHQMAVPAPGGYDKSAKVAVGGGLASATVAPAGRPGFRALGAARAVGKGTASDYQQRYGSKDALQVYEDTQYGLDG